MASENNNAIHQDTQSDFIRFPPTIVTSVEGNSAWKGHQAHLNYADHPAESLLPPETDTASSLAVLPSTSRVRTSSDSSGSHTPQTATSPIPGEEEECVCNTVLDPKAHVFRPISKGYQSDQPSDTTRESVRPELNDAVPVGTMDPEHSQDEPTGPREAQLTSTYEARLQTFFSSNWKDVCSFIAAEVLAEAGFKYTGPGDKVECVLCGLPLSEWAKGDDPMEQHRLHEGVDCFPVYEYSQHT